MDPSGIISALFAGIIIGLIARILVPSMQPIGCIVGIIGAFLGLLAGEQLGYGDSFWLVFLTQVFIAVVLVAITAFLFRKSSTG